MLNCSVLFSVPMKKSEISICVETIFEQKIGKKDFVALDEDDDDNDDDDNDDDDDDDCEDDDDNDEEEEEKGFVSLRFFVANFGNEF